MRLKIIYTISFIALVIITLSNTNRIASAGAPIGSTGAPDEATCGKAGCHTGNNNVNTGTGKLNLQMDHFSGTYLPGKVYTITTTIEQPHISRFGFAFTALNSTKQKAGVLQTTDDNRTQLMKGTNAFEGREYLTYKPLGTNPYKTNKGQWTFLWKAPEQNEGPITFFVAAVAANNDGTDKGDEVYTDSLVLTFHPSINH